MTGKYFGVYLLEKGHISGKTILRALASNRKERLPICALMVEYDLVDNMTLDRFDREASEQGASASDYLARSPSLDPALREKLENHEVRRWMYLAEELVCEHQYSLLELKQTLQEYREEVEAGQSAVNTALRKSEDEANCEQEVLRKIIEISMGLLHEYSNRFVNIVGAEWNPGPGDEEGYAVAQRMTGDLNAVFSLQFPRPLLQLVVSWMLKTDSEAGDELVQDAFAEFVNVVMGHVCTRLSIDRMSVMAEPPYRVSAGERAADAPCEAMAVRFRIGDEEFDTLFFYEK
ncbi:MAG: chemotaxis protein CheX, partial [Verrucomicrobiota bacterium]